MDFLPSSGTSFVGYKSPFNLQIPERNLDLRSFPQINIKFHTNFSLKMQAFAVGNKTHFERKIGGVIKEPILV